MDKQDRKQDSRKPRSPQESEAIQADPKVVETGQRLKEEMVRNTFKRLPFPINKVNG